MSPGMEIQQLLWEISSLHLPSESVKTVISFIKQSLFHNERVPQPLLICWVLQPLTILMASTALVPVRKNLSCTVEPQTAQSSPEMVSQVLKRGEGSLASLTEGLTWPSLWLASIWHSRAAQHHRLAKAGGCATERCTRVVPVSSAVCSLGLLNVRGI